MIDSHGAPTAFPAIIIGEDQEVPAGEVATHFLKVYSTLHVWAEEPGLTKAKAIVAAIRRALRGSLPDLGADRCLGFRFEGARYLRDPDGGHSHAVVTVESVVMEPA